MPDYGHPLVFGAFITPDARSYHETVRLAQVADELGFDILGVQDHPYQPSFLDTWTLLASLAGMTSNITLFTDVVNLALRPPAILARSAATLDLLSNGRVELGLGAGAYPKGVASLGGPTGTAGERVDALEEAIQILRALWTPGGPVSFAGKHYSLVDAKPGPAPLHDIGIFLGAYKPRMLGLTGRFADGWIPSSGYASPSELVTMNAVIDHAAIDAGRAPTDVRRWYNISGSFTSRDGGFLQGRPAEWVAQLTELAITQGISGFILAPGTAPEADLRRFAEEVAPGVREAVAAARGVAIGPDADGPADDRQLDLAPAERTTGHEPALDEATQTARPTARRREDDARRRGERADARQRARASAVRTRADSRRGRRGGVGTFEPGARAVADQPDVDAAELLVARRLLRNLLPGADDSPRDRRLEPVRRPAVAGCRTRAGDRAPERRA